MSEDAQVINMVNDASNKRRTIEENRKVLEEMSVRKRQTRKEAFIAEMLQITAEILVCILIIALATIAMYTQVLSAAFTNTIVTACIVYIAIRLDRRFGR